MVQPLVLASSFSLAILVFCCRGDNPFMLFFDIFGAMDELVASYGIGALLCCAAIVVLPSNTHRSRILWSVASTLLCMAGVLEALFANTGDITHVAIASGFTLGAGSVGLIAQWACIAAKLPQRSIPPSIALSFLIATLLWLVLQLVNSFTPICLGLMIFIMCSGIVLVISTAVERHAAHTFRDMGMEPPENPATQTFEQQSFEQELFEQTVTGQVHPVAPEPSKPVPVRAALFSVDILSFSRRGRISWEHAFEAIGALIVAFFMLGVMYWPDAVELQQVGAILKPLAYALASFVVLFVTARGTVASIASGGEGRLRRVVLIAGSLLALMTFTVLPMESIVPPAAVRFVNYAALAVLTVYGVTVTFSSILRHDPSPTFACAVIVFLAGIGMALGILAVTLMGRSAYFIAACIAGLYLMGLVVFASLSTPPTLS